MLDSLRRIGIVASNYPSPSEIWRGAFVSKFAYSLEGQGVSVEVVAPQRAHKALQAILSPRRVRTAGIVHRPVYFSLGNGRPFQRTRVAIGYRSFALASARGANSLRHRPDVVYAHFIDSALGFLHSGACPHVPLFIGLGESGLPERLARCTADDLRLLAERPAGFLCVAEHLKETLISQLKVPGDAILVAPNAVDDTLFFPQSREAERVRLQLPVDATIACFVGSFTERKGPDRVLDATRSMPELRHVFIGSGGRRLNDPRILFQGAVANDELPHYLNAADLFVLPTLAEGSCNAVLEAMACGLPVVTSDLATLRAQFPHGGALFVDPMDLEAIGASVRRLVEDTVLRQAASACALQSAACWSQAVRVRSILDWMRSRLAQSMNPSPSVRGPSVP